MKHIESYKIFESNQQAIDEFFSVMQGTPEGEDFMKWFVADPKRTGRIYITTKNGTGVYIPSITHFDKESSGQWSYRYVSSGNVYGEQYGDLKWLFRRIIIDSIIKNIPPGIKRAEIEEFFSKNPITPGTLPDKLQPLIDLFIQSERGELIRDMRFLKDLPWIQSVTRTGIYDIVDEIYDPNQFSIRYNSYKTDNILGISGELQELLSSLGIRFVFRNNIQGIRFIPGPKGRKRQKTDRGTRYDFYLGYETEEEITKIAEKEISKCLQELSCKVEMKEDWSNIVDVNFMKENLESLIKYGKPLPDYEDQFNNFIAEIIGARIKKDFSKIVLLKDYKGIVEILRNKRPDIFGKSEEEAKNLIKGASALKRFGALGDD